MMPVEMHAIDIKTGGDSPDSRVGSGVERRESDRRNSHIIDAAKHHKMAEFLAYKDPRDDQREWTIQHQHSYLAVIFRIKGSILQIALPKILWCCFCAAAYKVLDDRGYLRLDGVEASQLQVIGLGLSFLLVFRNNVAFNRFWDGRAQIGNILSNIRTLGSRLDFVRVSKPAHVDSKTHARLLLFLFYELLRNTINRDVRKDQLMGERARQRDSATARSSTPVLPPTPTPDRSRAIDRTRTYPTARAPRHLPIPTPRGGGRSLAAAATRRRRRAILTRATPPRRRRRDATARRAGEIEHLLAGLSPHELQQLHSTPRKPSFVLHRCRTLGAFDSYS